jgi:hypothetical protein
VVGEDALKISVAEDEEEHLLALLAESDVEGQVLLSRHSCLLTSNPHLDCPTHLGQR